MMGASPDRQTMKIITYTAPDDAPASLRYAAAMLLDGQTVPLWWTAAATPEEAHARLTALSGGG